MTPALLQSSATKELHMARHIFIHFHDETAHDPSNGQFTAGGAGHALKSHVNEASAHADVATRRGAMEKAGFKHTHSEPSLTGTNHHLAHPDGSRAVISHTEDPLSGRHKVHSLINTMNQGKGK